MPRFYCDYCDAYLTHDSPYGRMQHNRGWKHRESFKSYYQKLYPQWLAESQQKQLEMMQNIQMGNVIGSMNMTGPPPPPGMMPPGMMPPGMMPPGMQFPGPPNMMQFPPGPPPNMMNPGMPGMPPPPFPRPPPMPFPRPPNPNQP